MESPVAQQEFKPDWENTGDKGKKYCQWVFTLFGYDDKKIKWLCEYDKIRYMRFQKEICPTTGRKHLQGFFSLKTGQSFAALKKNLSPIGSPCLAIMKGTVEDNVAYCSKSETRDPECTQGYSIGKLPEKGKRTDLNLIKDEIVAGAKVDEICMERPMLFHQYGRTLRTIEAITQRHKYRTWMTKCLWLFGKTGTGKSQKAMEGYNPDTHYRWELNDKGWQDSYTGQETVIIDDFRGEIKYNELLRMIDQYPYNVSRRGQAPAPFLAKLIIITSPLSPEQIYCRQVEKDDSLDQLYRRIDILELVHDRYGRTVEIPAGGRGPVLFTESLLSGGRGNIRPDLDPKATPSAIVASPPDEPCGLREMVLRMKIDSQKEPRLVSKSNGESIPSRAG